MSPIPLEWSSHYRPEWDNFPYAYVEHEVVRSGRSRRLAKYRDRTHAFTAYIGVYHSASLGGDEAAGAKFFLSLILGGRTLSLHTYPTMIQVHEALQQFIIRIHGTPYTVEDVRRGDTAEPTQ